MDARVHRVIDIGIGEQVQAGAEALHAGLVSVVVDGKGFLGIRAEQITGIVGLAGEIVEQPIYGCSCSGLLQYIMAEQAA